MRMLMEGSNGYRRVVLVVEDEVCCAESLQLLLQFYGCKVLIANSCEDGLALLQENRESIDLILLDIMMPVMSGIDFLIEAKRKGILRRVPVVIQSAESVEIIYQAMAAGACGYIKKPYVKEEIFKLLKKLGKHNILKNFNEVMAFVGLGIRNVNKISKEVGMHEP